MKECAAFLQVLLGVLERGTELTDLQPPQADASGSDGELPDRWAFRHLDTLQAIISL